MMHDYKNLNTRRRDELLDDLATGASFITVAIVALFYLLALVPKS